MPLLVMYPFKKEYFSIPVLPNMASRRTVDWVAKATADTPTNRDFVYTGFVYIANWAIQ